MIANLQSFYKDTILTTTAAPSSPGYFWIEVGAEKLGIPSNQLSQAEKNLLEALYPSSRTIRQNSRQLNWRLFFEEDDKLPLTNWKQLRILYFTITQEDLALQEWEEALLSFFHPDSILVWTSQTEGFILEESKTHSIDREELETIIHTLEMDFYCGMRFYIGSQQNVGTNLRSHYRMEKNSFFKALAYNPTKKVYSIQSAFLYLLLSGLGPETNWYIKEILGDTARDQEMIKTIKTYLAHNQNATLTAKELFIHRNSLQYRIDKFIDKTGLDIKQFQDAAVVYMAILLLKAQRNTDAQ
ncbi:PucR family transcriptional regulator [Bacillus testis]|uniref:PucR family transcriptional regulator n=1 Tax=Bacillus testis TaxID=1622072 RepID=UPI00067E7075|nr:helix-turn-helix domain-containing protein [Bacillus testis]